MALSKEEINRKLLHVFSGSAIPAGIFYIPKYIEYKFAEASPIPANIYPIIILSVLMFFFILVELARFRLPWLQAIFFKYCGSMLREKEKGKLTGATYIIASSLICSILFINQPHISAMVLSTFIWGDAAAALVGLSIGKIKIGTKSLEGSIGCFILCLSTFLFLFPIVPGLLETWNYKIPAFLGIIAAFSITIMELFPITLPGKFEINDNLTVPVITGYILLFLYPMF